MIPQEAPLTAQITITGYLPSAKVAEIQWPDQRITHAVVNTPAHLEQLINQVFIGHPVEADLELRTPDRHSPLPEHNAEHALLDFRPIDPTGQPPPVISWRREDVAMTAHILVKPQSHPHTPNFLMEIAITPVNNPTGKPGWQAEIAISEAMSQLLGDRFRHANYSTRRPQPATLISLSYHPTLNQAALHAETLAITTIQQLHRHTAEINAQRARNISEIDHRITQTNRSSHG